MDGHFSRKQVIYNSSRQYGSLISKFYCIYIQGFYVYIRNHTDFAFNLSPSPLFLTPGMGTRIAVQRVFYSQFNEWPYAYGECSVRTSDVYEWLMHPPTDRSLYDAVSAYPDFAYSRNACYAYCFQLLNTRLFNCTDYYSYFQIDGFDFCSLDTPVVSALNPGTHVTDFCLPRCPLECQSQSLDSWYSTYRYPPSAYYVDQLKANADTNAFGAFHRNQSDYEYDLIDNLVEFSVFYDRLAYTLIEEEPRITAEALIGTIGGHLHIFLGMSFIGFIEIVETFVHLVEHGLKPASSRRSRERRRSTDKTSREGDNKKRGGAGAHQLLDFNKPQVNAIRIEEV